MVMPEPEPEGSVPGPAGIPIACCRMEMASLPLAAVKLARAWVVVKTVKGKKGTAILEEQVMPDADIRGWIKDRNEVAAAIIPSTKKWSRASGTKKELDESTGPNEMRGRVAMAILAWGPLHAGNLEHYREELGTADRTLWLKRMRFEALCRGLLTPEGTEEAEAMLSDKGTAWLYHHKESVGTYAKFAGSAGVGLGRCEEHEEAQPCLICAMEKEHAEKMLKEVAKKDGTKKARLGAADFFVKAPMGDDMVECEVHEILYDARGDCPLCEPREDLGGKEMRSCDKHGEVIYFKKVECPGCRKAARGNSECSGGGRLGGLIEMANALAAAIGQVMPGQKAKGPRKREAWEMSDDDEEGDGETTPQAKLNALLKGMTKRWRHERSAGWTSLWCHQQQGAGQKSST